MEKPLESAPPNQRFIRSNNSARTADALLDTMLHITTVVHTLIFAFLVLILCICFSEEWSFFTWHPLLMTIGWWLLASEGILLLRRDNIISTYLNHQWKIRLHWLIQIVATALTIAAFVVVFINKNRNNRDHFTSYHGKFGLVAVVFSVAALLGGTVALYSAALRSHIKPSLNKAIHILGGILSFGFGIVTFAFAVFSSHWFQNRVNESEAIKITFFVILIVTGLWTLVKPCISCINKVIQSIPSR